jgi:hypothetical protein
MTSRPMLMLASEQLPENNVTYGVNVDLDAWVICRVYTRERDEGSGSSTATTSDTDLRARDVKLGSASVARLMQGDVLDSQEIITRW